MTYSSVSWVSFGLALAAVLALLVATTFMTPVSNDAGAYLTIADAILAGKLPYRDIFDHKTPGIYYTFAAVLALSSRSLLAVQVVQWLAVVAMAGLIGWLGWRLWGALATAAALALLLRRPGAAPSTSDWLVAGGLVGIAALFKQTGLLTLLALAVWAASIQGGWRQVTGRWLALAAGCAAPLALAVAYFAVQGALADLWRDAVWVNLANYPRARLSSLLRGNLANLRAFPLVWLGVLAALFFHRPSLRRSAVGHAPTLLWLTLLASLLPLSHRVYSHYVLQALPAAALLAAAGLATLWQRLASRPLPLRAMVLAALLAIALLDLPAWPRYLSYTQRLVDQQQAAAMAVQTISQPGEPILAISAAAQSYFLSDRPPASRWVYLYPVNHTAQSEAELAGLIQSHAVPAVVVADSEELPWHNRLRSVIETNCALHQSFGPDLHIYDCR